MQARDISKKLKEIGAKNGSARARSRQVLPYSANWGNDMYAFYMQVHSQYPNPPK